MKFTFKNMSGSKTYELHVEDPSKQLDDFIDNIKNEMSVAEDKNVRLICMGRQLDIKKSFIDNQLKDNAMIICVPMLKPTASTVPTTQNVQPVQTASTAQTASAAQNVQPAQTAEAAQNVQPAQTAEAAQNNQSVQDAPQEQNTPPAQENIWHQPPREEDTVASDNNNLHNVEQIHASFILTFMSVLTDPRILNVVRNNSGDNVVNILGTQHYRNIIRTHLDNANFLNMLRSGSVIMSTPVTVSPNVSLVSLLSSRILPSNLSNGQPRPNVSVGASVDVSQDENSLGNTADLLGNSVDLLGNSANLFGADNQNSGVSNTHSLTGDMGQVMSMLGNVFASSNLMSRLNELGGEHANLSNGLNYNINQDSYDEEDEEDDENDDNEDEHENINNQNESRAQMHIPSHQSDELTDADNVNINFISSSMNISFEEAKNAYLMCNKNVDSTLEMLLQITR
jgi:hypothetical protein